MQWPKRWAATRRRRRIARRRFNVAVYDYLMPLCAVAVLVFVFFGPPAADRAARGEGQAGTFTAERQECAPRQGGRYGSGGDCSWYGAFLSGDGSVRVQGVRLDANAPRHVGDTVPVLYYEGRIDPPEVYPAGFKYRLRTWLVVLGIAGYVAWKGWQLVRRARRRRRTLDARALGR